MRLAEEGCRLLLSARGSQDLENAKSEALALGAAEVHTLVADMEIEGEACRCVNEAASTLGGVDLLVVNAGASFGGAFLETDRVDWERTMAINLFHAVESVRAAAPLMSKRGGGSVVLITSISGRKPVHRRVQYGAAKAAVIHMARSLALELSPFRVRVNSVSPGSTLITGGGWDRFRTEEPERFNRFVLDELPWGRLARPKEIANVVTFLLSERASWINGADIPVDGAQGRPSAF